MELERLRSEVEYYKKQAELAENKAKQRWVETSKASIVEESKQAIERNSEHDVSIDDQEERELSWVVP